MHGRSLALSFALFFLPVASILSAGPALAQPSYVGSAACGLCHKATYDKWKDTLHNKSQQEVSLANDPVVVQWAGTVKLKAGNLPEATIELREGPDGVHYATLIDACERGGHEAVRTHQHEATAGAEE